MVALAELAPPVAPPKANALDKLRALAAKTPASKKSETPVAEAQDLGPVIEQWMEAKRQVDYHQSLVDSLGAQIRAEAKPRWLAACRRANKVVSSVKLRATIDGTPQDLTVTQTSRYCRIANETEPQQQRLAELQAAFPADHERYFANVITVTPAESVANDPEFLAAYVQLLMDHYGEAGFAEKFNVSSTYTPTKAFHEAYVLRPEVQAGAEDFIADECVKPYSASIKV